MLGNDRIETASTKVTSIRRRNDKEKSTWRTQQYFVDFESRIHVEIPTSNRCHNFHVDLPFKIDVISTKLPRGISTLNRWRMNEDVSIGSWQVFSFYFHCSCFLNKKDLTFCMFWCHSWRLKMFLVDFEHTYIKKWYYAKVFINECKSCESDNQMFFNVMFSFLKTKDELVLT